MPQCFAVYNMKMLASCLAAIASLRQARRRGIFESKQNERLLQDLKAKVSMVVRTSNRWTGKRQYNIKQTRYCAHHTLH